MPSALLSLETQKLRWTSFPQHILLKQNFMYRDISFEIETCFFDPGYSLTRQVTKLTVIKQSTWSSSSNCPLPINPLESAFDYAAPGTFSNFRIPCFHSFSLSDCSINFPVQTIRELPSLNFWNLMLYSLPISLITQSGNFSLSNTTSLSFPSFFFTVL